MLDFLCGWEEIQKGNTGSRIPCTKNVMIPAYLCVLLIRRVEIYRKNKVTLSAIKLISTCQLWMGEQGKGVSCVFNDKTHY